MLIRSQAELSLVYLCNLPQSGLEVSVGLILYTTVLDEASEMILAILARLPTEIVNITVEGIPEGTLTTEAEKFFYLCSEGIETHAVNRTLSVHSFGCVELSAACGTSDREGLTQPGCRCPAAQA